MPFALFAVVEVAIGVRGRIGSDGEIRERWNGSARSVCPLPPRHLCDAPSGKRRHCGVHSCLFSSPHLPRKGRPVECEGLRCPPPPRVQIQTAGGCRLASWMSWISALKWLTPDCNDYRYYFVFIDWRGGGGHTRAADFSSCLKSSSAALGNTIR